MPTLSEATNRFTISNELQHQTSSKTKTLLWMKSNPEKCHNTSIRGLATTISLDKERPLGLTTFSTEQVIHSLIRQGLVIRQGFNKHYNFIINHGHPEMPTEIDEGIIKTTQIPKSSVNVYRENGDVLSNLILKWMREHPLKTYNTTTREIAQEIVDSKEFQTTKDSAQTVIARLVREGRLNKQKLDDKPRGKANFSLVDDHGANYYNSEPQLPSKEKLDNNIPTSESNNKEKEMEPQEVNLPEGRVINLTININLK